jgi:GT2 family glycosyltransferase
VAVVLQVGGFDASFKSVADRVWGNAIADAGYGVAFANDAIVYHPARKTVRELLRKRRRLAGGHHDLARKKGLSLLRLINALRQQLVGNPLWAATQLAGMVRTVGVRTALQVLGLYIFLCYAEAFERVRLQLGGETRR